MAAAPTVAGRDAGCGVTRLQSKHPLSGELCANPVLRHTQARERTLNRESQSQSARRTDGDAGLAPSTDAWPQTSGL